MPALTTLMPPVVDTFQKAFIYTKNMRIYFSPSSFNSFSTSWKVHVTVRNQKNNENAINLENYPNGIIVYSYNKGYYYDSKKKMYYLDIAPTMLADTSEFLINQYYKVQLRFDECPIAYMQSGQIYDKINYMINNLAYFSEWSTVTLIKPISKPELDIEQFVEDPLEVNWGTLRLTGSLNFVDALGNTINTKETERLYSYKIYVYEPDNDEAIFESETLYPNENHNYGGIAYLLDLQSIVDYNDIKTDNYKLKVSYVTTNQYTNSKVYNFKFKDMEQGDFNIITEIDNEEGYIALTISNSRRDIQHNGIVYVRRTSSLSSYKKWEDIVQYRLTNNKTQDGQDIHNLVFIDYTVQDLTWYKYSIQFESYEQLYRLSFATDLEGHEKFFIDFNGGIFLYRQNRQLPIRYDAKVSNYKININRVKVDTLGSKYPKFAENPNLQYRQLTISGVISAEADVFQSFLTKRGYFGDEVLEDYNGYKIKDGIVDLERNDFKAGQFLLGDLTTTAEDVLWEREFREQVNAWMIDGEPKLFKSTTEGNIIVMLMDYNLTPKDQLNRRLYDFSVTAYEVGDGNKLHDLHDLDIQPFEEVALEAADPVSSTSGFIPYSLKTKDLSIVYVDEKPYYSVLQTLIDKYSVLYAGIDQQKSPVNFRIHQTGLFFYDGPGQYVVSVLPENGTSYIDLVTPLPHNDGYISYYLPEPFIAYDIRFPVEVGDCEVTFLMDYDESELADDIISGEKLLLTERINGQIALNILTPAEGQENEVVNLYQMIVDKYDYTKYDSSLITERLIDNLRAVSIDAAPGTKIHIDYLNDEVPQSQEFVLNYTGYLNLESALGSYNITNITVQFASRQRLLFNYKVILKTWVRQDA